MSRYFRVFTKSGMRDFSKPEQAGAFVAQLINSPRVMMGGPDCPEIKRVLTSGLKGKQAWMRLG